MENIQIILEQIGLDHFESRVYLHLLESGEKSASVVSKALLIPRSTTRGVLDKLCLRGIVSKIYKRNTQYYDCRPPADLLKYLEKEINKKQDLMGKVAELVPTLNDMRSDQGIVPKVRFFEGQEQVVEAFNLSLFDESIKELLIFTSYDFLQDPVIRKNDDEFFMKTRVKKKIPARVLVGKTPTSITMPKKSVAELRERRFIPGKYKLPGNIHIYGNNVLYFSTKGEEYMAVMVEGALMSETMRALFEYMWDGCA
ncbi:hypothetical protein CVV38_01055 [Candidatus Peregrinibacteria bacterium HGW-Peregrinibacteria-1]|jgi:sugar-specific transcriptional regulator TrmB|nr:MAG: hypothetical protein CVV38_01055 [Candidatus Peregrinibacteria bacterium HGW-Peregrinibacteria-1]